MKEIFVYQQYAGNLRPIKSVSNTLSDRNYLIALIEYLFSATGGYLYVEMSRPNWNTDRIKNRLQEISFISDGLQMSDEDFELSFSCKEKPLDASFLYLLPEIWFTFEHGVFCFFVDAESPMPTRRSSWNKITEFASAFVMFRGPEEDVVWIGKSEDLAFNFR
jgi:hypothetical protein